MLADQSKYLSDQQKTQNSAKIIDFKHKIYDFYSLLLSLSSVAVLAWVRRIRRPWAMKVRASPW
jgi:hypothetical protein